MSKTFDQLSAVLDYMNCTHEEEGDENGCEESTVPTRMGKLTAIVGAMGGGKTTRLLEEAQICEEQGLRYLIIKSTTDRRRIDPVTQLLSSRGEDNWEDSEGAIWTHDGRQAPCLTVDSLGQLPSDIHRLIDVLLVDEMHFLNDDAPFCINSFLEKGVSVMVACLRTDYQARPFPPSSWLMSHGTVIQKDPDCNICHAQNEGIYTDRIVQTVKETIVCGGLDDYRPLCRTCYKKACPTFYAAMLECE